MHILTITPFRTPATTTVRTIRDAFRHNRLQILTALIALFALNLWAWGLRHNDVLDAAYAIPDGGGYCKLDDTGVQHTITHNGSVILSSSKQGSYYCCGFTFDIAMQIAQRRGLIADKPVTKIRQFEHEWYGSTKTTHLKQCATAVVNLGIGREINPVDAAPGDFVNFIRTGGFGHSVIFLNWTKDDSGHIVGLHYRSSQPPNGVGDGFECFTDTGYGSIDRQQFFVARLNRSRWSRILYPFSN